ncbi:MAG: DUF3313 family protein [Nitrospirales bacterium]|nr:DUF3313 family protein [Nitrospirales bacterium]
MSHAYRVCIFFVLALSIGCAPSQQVEEVNLSGFLEDYSMLRKEGKGEPALIYRHPIISLASYDKALIDTVTVWLKGDSGLSEIPLRELRQLQLLLHVKIIEALRRESYHIVQEPGPRVMRIQAALTEAEQSNVVLDMVSTILPQAHLLSGAKKLATGTHSFVGKAGIEAKITDAETGELLVAAVDRRAGGKTLQGSTNSWDDVEQAFQFWSDRFSYRLCQERGRGFCVPPE